MKYPCVISTSTPRGLIAWLGEQLDLRGIDSTLYTRYVLSLLLADTILEDYHHECSHLPQFVYREYLPVKQGRRKSWYYHKADWDFCYCTSSCTFESKKSEALECLKSATEQVFGLEDLIDELCEKLQKWKAGFDPFDKEKLESPTVTPPPSPKEHQQKYYDAFPSLSEKQAYGKSANKYIWGQKYISTTNHDKYLSPNERFENAIEDEKQSLNVSPNSLPFKKVRKSPKKKHLLEHNDNSHLISIKTPEKRRNNEIENNSYDDSFKVLENGIKSIDSSLIKMCTLKSPEKKRKLSFSSSTVSHITFSFKPLNDIFLKPYLKIDISINVKTSIITHESFLQNGNFPTSGPTQKILDIPLNENGICKYIKSENTPSPKIDSKSVKASHENVLEKLPLSLLLSESLKKVIKGSNPKMQISLHEKRNSLKLHNSTNNIGNSPHLYTQSGESIEDSPPSLLVKEEIDPHVDTFNGDNSMHMLEWKEADAFYSLPPDDISNLKGKEESKDLETDLVYTKTNKPLASHSNWTFQTNGLYSSQYNISQRLGETSFLNKSNELCEDESHFLSSRVISKRRLITFFNDTELSSSPSPKISKLFDLKENLEGKLQQLHDLSLREVAKCCDTQCFEDIDKEMASYFSDKQLEEKLFNINEPTSSLNNTSYYPLDPFPLLSNNHLFFTSHILYKQLAEESRVYRIWDPTITQEDSGLSFSNPLNIASHILEHVTNSEKISLPCFTQYDPSANSSKEPELLEPLSDCISNFSPNFIPNLNECSFKSSSDGSTLEENDLELDKTHNSFFEESLFDYYPFNSYLKEDLEIDSNPVEALSPSYMEEDSKEQLFSVAPPQQSFHHFKSDSFKPKASKRPCTYFLEGNCLKPNCRFSHNLRTITCKFWLMNQCFKGDTCPFLHGYPPKKWHGPKKREKIEHTFILESELDFPPLSSAVDSMKDGAEKKSSKKKKLSKSKQT